MHGENCPFHPIFLLCDRTRITEKAERKPVRHCQKPVIIHMPFLWFLGVIQIYELHALSCVQEETRRRPDNVTACETACLWSPVPSFPTRWAGPLTRDPEDLAPEIIRKHPNYHFSVKRNTSSTAQWSMSHSSLYLWRISAERKRTYRLALGICSARAKLSQVNCSSSARTAPWTPDSRRLSANSLRPMSRIQRITRSLVQTTTSSSSDSLRRLRSSSSFRL